MLPHLLPITMLASSDNLSFLSQDGPAKGNLGSKYWSGSQFDCLDICSPECDWGGHRSHLRWLYFNSLHSPHFSLEHLDFLYLIHVFIGNNLAHNRGVDQQLYTLLLPRT